MDEKRIEDMTAAELRAGVTDFFKASQPGPAPAPLAPGMAATDTDKARETAGQLYAESIMKRPTGTWTAEERAFIRASTHSALRDLGY